MAFRSQVELWRPGYRSRTVGQPDAVTYVMRVVDRSQIEGPDETVLDSALRTVVDVEVAARENA